MNRAWLLVLATGCDPVFHLTVQVTSDEGVPLADASLALTRCTEQDAAGNAARLTDADGVAEIGGAGFEFPPCDLTVALPGFQPWESSFDALCNGDREDCDRVQLIDVVLEPNP